MAKALLGHVGPFDMRLTMEVRRLQMRVRELEAELAAERAAHELEVHGELLSLPEPEFA
jgi:hypothetical protein